MMPERVGPAGGIPPSVVCRRSRYNPLWETRHLRNIHGFRKVCGTVESWVRFSRNRLWHEDLNEGSLLEEQHCGGWGIGQREKVMRSNISTDPTGSSRAGLAFQGCPILRQGDGPFLCFPQPCLSIQILEEGCLQRVWILGKAAFFIKGHFPKSGLAVSYLPSAFLVAGIVCSLLWRKVKGLNHSMSYDYHALLGADHVIIILLLLMIRANIVVRPLYALDTVPNALQGWSL